MYCTCYSKVQSAIEQGQTTDLASVTGEVKEIGEVSEKEMNQLSQGPREG